MHPNDDNNDILSISLNTTAQPEGFVCNSPSQIEGFIPIEIENNSSKIEPGAADASKGCSSYAAHMFCSTVSLLGGAGLCYWGAINDDEDTLKIGATVAGVGATWGTLATCIFLKKRCCQSTENAENNEVESVYVRMDNIT